MLLVVRMNVVISIINSMYITGDEPENAQASGCTLSPWTATLLFGMKLIVL